MYCGISEFLLIHPAYFHPMKTFARSDWLNPIMPAITAAEYLRYMLSMVGWVCQGNLVFGSIICYILSRTD